MQVSTGFTFGEISYSLDESQVRRLKPERGINLRIKTIPLIVSCELPMKPK